MSFLLHLSQIADSQPNDQGGIFLSTMPPKCLYQAKVPCITPKNAVPIQVMHQIKVVEANKVVL